MSLSSNLLLVISFFLHSMSYAIQFNLHGTALDFPCITGENISLGRNDRILAQAVDLQIRLPTSYRIVACPRALIQGAKITCNYNGSTALIDRDVAVAYDFPGAVVFQHDYINGLPYAGMLAAWVQQDLSQRAFLCAERVCEVLRALDWVTNENIIELKQLPGFLYVRSLHVALNDWVAENLTWDSYPPGASFPVEAYLTKVAANTTMPSTPLLLYLSRGGPGSNRYIKNEAHLVDALTKWAQSNGAALKVLPHKHSLSRKEQQQLFYTAKYVVGLHGGAFSNIVFCNRRATILEINSCHTRRDCFAVMALIRGLSYARVCTPSCMAYSGGSAVTLSAHDINVVIDTLAAFDADSRYGPVSSVFVPDLVAHSYDTNMLIWVSIATAGLAVAATCHCRRMRRRRWNLVMVPSP